MAAMLILITPVTEAGAVKKFETACIIDSSLTDEETEWRYCCMYEVDTESGEKKTLECWWEICEVQSGDCGTVADSPAEPPVDPRDLAQGLGEQEVLPTPPSSGGSTPEGVSDRPLGEQEVLPTPPTTTPTTPEEDIIDRAPGQGQVLPTPPTTTQNGEGDITRGTVTDRLPFGEQEVLPTPPETTMPEEDEGEQTESEEAIPEAEECGEGETFNEQTGECEPETTQEQDEQE